jgi:hypothetical protein
MIGVSITSLETADILMITPVLTLGQEMSNSPVSEKKTRDHDEFATEATLVPHVSVLYLMVSTTCYAIAWLTFVLIPKCSRYAISDSYIRCMLLRLTDWCCAQLGRIDILTVYHSTLKIDIVSIHK